MLKKLLARWKPAHPASAKLYGAIVAAARQETLYRDWGVPDTAMGRFEMVALHVAVMQRRLKELGPEGEELARTLGEDFITDMDDCMREIGVGDLTVPKKIKIAAAALFDRYNDYGAALTANDVAQLTGAIDTHVSGSAKPTALAAGRLASYVIAFDGALRGIDRTRVLGGDIGLPVEAGQ
ncbi:MAG: ubiquinol-cytochrome C chaperone family protein [Hyphomicrobiaceae bacterium]|nr:ubiquinol-cytochrome C chaperone [Hyphomicrobiaceae bacterium]